MALQLKVQTARLAVDIYEKHGVQAVKDNKAQVVSEALINVIDANIAIAGLANSIRGEIPTLGVAHAIHNRLTYEPALRDWLHGERVGYSLLVQSFLEGDGENAGRYAVELTAPVRNAADAGAAERDPPGGDPVRWRAVSTFLARRRSIYRFRWSLRALNGRCA